MTTPHETCQCGMPAEIHCHACDEWSVRNTAPTGQPAPAVKPGREEIARLLLSIRHHTPETCVVMEQQGHPWWLEALEQADAVLALLPGKTEAEVKAEALREAAAEFGSLGSTAGGSRIVSIQFAHDCLRGWADKVERGESS